MKKKSVSVQAGQFHVLIDDHVSKTQQFTFITDHLLEAVPGENFITQYTIEFSLDIYWDRVKQCDK